MSGKTDRLFPLSGAVQEFNKIKEIYKALGAENNCVQVVGDGGHSFFPELGWDTIKKMI